MGRNPINVCALMDLERLDQRNVKVVFLLFYHYYSDFIMIINIITKTGISFLTITLISQK